ncbi:hypothetical protein E4U42_001854 [Claviceps africana]|uniref:Protein kinase domain-containing protein n=1 Tax=Claviceps africana TaxID=83212 RepID=A0A8K0JIN2_9HYPO|nr:hypothetical protein E4U42_001854 [Claviceps africana]
MSVPKCNIIRGLQTSAKQTIWKDGLYKQYKIFTDGSQYWMDNYLLEKWANSERPVELRVPLVAPGLTSTSASNFVTVKFVGRTENEQVECELGINKFLRDRCQSDYVCTIEDSFTISHHLAKSDRKYKDVTFDAITYPPTGSDLQRIQTFSVRDDSKLPLSIEMRVKCVKDIIRGVAELHNLGIVHADIHPGNVALPAPPIEEIQMLLKEPLIEHQVERDDGAPTPECLPKFVIKPDDLGFGNGACKVMDFGFSFHYKEGAVFQAKQFSYGAARAIEFETSQTTSQPFKIYYILTDGARLMDNHRIGLKFYRKHMAKFNQGRDTFFKDLPLEVQETFQPIVSQLVYECPTKRLSVADLALMLKLC